MTIEYPGFKVVYPDIEVTIDNFFRHSMWIYLSTGATIIVSKEELSLSNVNNLLSGDIQSAKTALQDILNRREREIKKLKEICSQID